MTVFTRVEYATAIANPKDAAAYTDGDVVGGLLTFSVPGPVKQGMINAIVLVDDDNEGAALDLFIFDDTPSTIADDAAFAPTAADLKKLIYKCAIAAADYGTEGSIKFAIKEDINQVFKANGAGKLYGYLVCNGSTPTYAADKTLDIRLGLLTEG